MAKSQLVTVACPECGRIHAEIRVLEQCRIRFRCSNYKCRVYFSLLGEVSSITIGITPADRKANGVDSKTSTLPRAEFLVEAPKVMETLDALIEQNTTYRNWLDRKLTAYRSEILSETVARQEAARKKDPAGVVDYLKDKKSKKTPDLDYTAIRTGLCFALNGMVAAGVILPGEAARLKANAVHTRGLNELAAAVGIGKVA